MNEISKNYSWIEMINIYKQSKIVVNISRDDFLQDANLRCFEAMGCDALVITKLPTELSQLGFTEGEHFIGFEDIKDLVELIKYYLKNEDKRHYIARQGQNLVLSKHTYTLRAQSILDIIKRDGRNAMLENKLRKHSPYNKLHSIAYSYYKDNQIQKMLDCLILSKKRPSLNLLMLSVRLFLVKFKRILFLGGRVL